MGNTKAIQYLVLILQEEGRKELSLCVCHSSWCERWMAAMSHVERPRASRKKHIEGDVNLVGTMVVPLNMLSFLVPVWV